MANSYVRYTGNGVTTSFSLTFDYLSQDDIVVTVDGVAATFTWLNDTTVSISPAPANGLVVEVRRVTPSDIPAVDFQNGAVVTEDQLDTNAKQALYVSQEAEDDANDKLGKDEDLNWDAASKKIRNVADPVLDNDAANKGWVVDQIAADVAAAAASATAAAASETAAAASETASAASETAAASSASAASTSASSASTSASSASTSASSASTSATNASSSASAAATSATNAATSATNASNSASAASTSATNASSSASAAATSASNAATSATAAATSATAAAASAATLTGTSTTSNTPAVGSMTWTTQAGKAWTAGAYVQISSAGTPAVWAFGQVTSYSSTTLIVDVQAIGTASAKTDWNINYAGVRGAAGASGATITVGSTAVASGTTTRVLYNNSGSVGEYQVTGSGKVVMDTSPALVTPTLGTPASGVLTNCTGLPFGGLTNVTVVPQGRLTLVTAVPVMTSAQTAKTTIYYTPYVGALIPIYDGSNWSLKQFSELSNITTNSSTGNAGPAATTTNSNYDLFVWSNSGTLTLTRGPAWTSDTARGTGVGTTQLTMTNGIYTNTVAITNGPGAGLGTYVGTVRTDGSSQVNWNPTPAAAAGGGNARVDVFNAYNRVKINPKSQDNTASWTYNTNTWRSTNNSTSNRINYVDGLGELAVAVTASISCNPGASNSGIGVNRDSTSATPSSTVSFQANQIAPGHCSDVFLPSLGFHYIQAMENNSTGSTNTFYGASSSTTGGQAQTLTADLVM